MLVYAVMYVERILRWRGTQVTSADVDSLLDCIKRLSVLENRTKNNPICVAYLNFMFVFLEQIVLHLRAGSCRLFPP